MLSGKRGFEDIGRKDDWWGQITEVVEEMAV